MAFPLIPFAAGIAVGTLVAHGFNDKQIHDRILHGAQGVYNRVAEGIALLIEKIPGYRQVEAETVEATKKEGNSQATEGESSVAASDAEGPTG